MGSGIVIDHANREIITATPYTLKRLGEVSEDRDPKRVDTKEGENLLSLG